MTLTERIAVLQRVADAVQSVRAALLPLSEADRREVLAGVVAELERPAVCHPIPATPAPAPPAPVPPPGKPSPRPAAEAGGGKRTTMAAGDARLELVRILAGHPEGLSLSELSRRTGVKHSHASYRLKHPWFRKSDPGERYSPWVLTDAGKAAAAQLDAS